MKIRIGRFILTISLSVAETIPELVDRFAIKHYSSKEYLARNRNLPDKIARIKACRQLGKQGEYDLPMYLKDAKQWVEKYFEDDGKGPIKK